MLESDDFFELEIQAYEVLINYKSGWAYFLIDGAKCPISLPQLSFVVRLPEGKKLELKNPAEPIFEADFRFRSRWRPPS